MFNLSTFSSFILNLLLNGTNKKVSLSSTILNSTSLFPMEINNFLLFLLRCLRLLNPFFILKKLLFQTKFTYFIFFGNELI